MAAKKPVIEIAVQDVHGVQIAKSCFADRVELCSALGSTGGITPSAGLIQQACHVGIPVHPLLRSRAGGFYVLENELAVMISDIRQAAELGCEGIVIGALQPITRRSQTAEPRNVPPRTFIQPGSDGQLPSEPLELAFAFLEQCILIATNLKLEVTIHRCVDVLLEQGLPPQELMQQLANLGATRVLTSGGAPATPQGLDVIAQLVQQDSVQVQAGGGVTLESIPALCDIGVDGIHLSAKTVTNIAGPSGPGGGDASFETTDKDLVEAAVLAVQHHG